MKKFSISIVAGLLTFSIGVIGKILEGIAFAGVVQFQSGIPIAVTQVLCWFWYAATEPGCGREPANV